MTVVVLYLAMRTAHRRFLASKQRIAVTEITSCSRLFSPAGVPNEFERGSKVRSAVFESVQSCYLLMTQAARNYWLLLVGDATKHDF
jgi:hypothetical protein